MGAEFVGGSHSGPGGLEWRLRQAFIAAYGPEGGAAATRRTLAYARRRRDAVESTANRAAALYRIGGRRSRRDWRHPVRFPPVPESAGPWVDDALPTVLQSLPVRPRVALVLCLGFHWNMAEVGALVGIPPSAVQELVAEASAKVESGLGNGAGQADRAVADQLAAYAEVLDHTSPQIEDAVSGGPGSSFHVSPWMAGIVALALTLALAGWIIANSRTDSGGSSATVSTAPPTPAFEVTTELLNPRAVAPAMFSQWQFLSSGPGAVAEFNGSFHMLSSAYGNGVATVAYAVSQDGVVWSQGHDLPVLDLSEAPWAPRRFDTAQPRSLVITEGGTWQLFFDITWFDQGTNQLRASIGRVVARDPAGLWIYDAEPIVRPSERQLWRAEQVASPSVVAGESGLIMLFAASGQDGDGVIGLARSDNGAQWEVQPRPVLIATEEWTGDSFSGVNLVRVPDGYAMFYSGNIAADRGLAIAEDPLDWVVFADNPILSAGDVPGVSIFDAEFVAADDSVVAYVEHGGREDREVAVLRLDLDVTAMIAALVSNR